MCGNMLLIIAILGFSYIYGPFEVRCFNLSPVPNLIIKMPNITTPKPKLRSSYFGFSLVLREKSIFIGAPRAQSTLESQNYINEPGAVYKCEFNHNETTTTTTTTNCYQYPIDSTGNLFTHFYLDHELKDYQWLGATMVGGTKNSDLLLVCAPHFVGGYDEAQENSYFHGICYGTYDTKRKVPAKKNIWKIKALTQRDKQSLTNGERDWFNHQFGEQGFSGHITADDKEIILGAPGILDWGGTVVRYTINSKKVEVPEGYSGSISYYGYAVTSGFLDSNRRNKIIYVMTSPHESIAPSTETAMGTASLFEFGGNNKKKNLIKVHRHLDGVQYGELFGYAALVEDVNGDDLDDVLITAPLYNIEDVDVGAIYVFINSGKFTFERSQIIAPFKTQARFGTAISKLGDINRDGYADIAVGAPFVDGHGAVVIYLGSVNGLQREPSQILGMEPPIETSIFGHALSLGVDIDGNGFPDLAIGAPEAETVYIYRSYPVVDVEMSIRGEKPRLEFDEKTLPIEFCYKIKTKSKILKSVALSLDIELDTRLRRMIFADSGDNRFQLLVNATTQNFCQTCMTNIKFMIDYMFQPMELKMKYELIDDGRQYKEKEFCNKCAVLMPGKSKNIKSEVAYKHGCREAICNVDLRVNASDIPNNFTLGTSNILYISYFIENLEENAYDAKIEITHSIILPYAKIPSSCVLENGFENKLSCKLGSGNAFTGNTTLEIGLDMSNIMQASRMNISAVATCAGNQIEPKFNALNKVIEFIVNSNLEILGKANETYVSILDKKESFDILYYFTLQNHGPSTLYRPIFTVFVPAAYINPKQEFISHINLNASYASIQLYEQKLPQINFEKYDVIDTEPYLEEHVIRSHQMLNENSTISLHCNASDVTKFVATPTCAGVGLPLPYLKSGQNFTVEVVLNINPKGVRKILKKKLDYLEMYLNMGIRQSFEGQVKLNVTKILSPEIIVNNVSHTPLWVYIVATCGGLFLLTLLALLLWRLGFFKRQTKEEMEELINEKIEKARMKAVLESETRAMDDQADFEELLYK